MGIEIIYFYFMFAFFLTFFFRKLVDIELRWRVYLFFRLSRRDNIKIVVSGGTMFLGGYSEVVRGKVFFMCF